MEDRHIIVERMDPVNENPISFFAVLDGHGLNNGHTCAEYLVNELPKMLNQFEKMYGDSNTGPFSRNDVIQSAFIATDDRFLRKKFSETSGSTATTCFIKFFKHSVEIICANVGDSRTIFFNKGEITALSTDHKPYNEEERKRIEAANGTVISGRLNGLAVSRSFGDRLAKQAFEMTDIRDLPLTSLPDITRTVIQRKSVDFRKGNMFLILACDGVWDVMTNEDAALLVEGVLQTAKGDLKSRVNSATERLVRTCIERGSSDNVTAIVVIILNEWR
jgi:serine/threonine protein phosphatase PrpC